LSILKADVVCTYIYFLEKRNTTTSNWKYLKFHSHIVIEIMCPYEEVVFLPLYSTHLLVRWHNSSSFLHVDCGGNNFGLLTAPHGLAGSQAKLVALLEKTLQKCRKMCQTLLLNVQSLLAVVVAIYTAEGVPN
jgi:hypothetical protein